MYNYVYCIYLEINSLILNCQVPIYRNLNNAYVMPKIRLPRFARNDNFRDFVIAKERSDWSNPERCITNGSCRCTAYSDVVPYLTWLTPALSTLIRKPKFIIDQFNLYDLRNCLKKSRIGNWFIKITWSTAKHRTYKS